MTGFGIIIAFVGYAVLYWGIQAIQSKDQQPFISYLYPSFKAV